jgi:hypothetical protein
MSGPKRKPLIDARPVVPIEDFCSVSGLPRSTVEELMRSGDITGGLWEDYQRVVAKGLFEDELPSRAELLGLGLTPRDGY